MLCNHPEYSPLQMCHLDVFSFTAPSPNKVNHKLAVQELGARLPHVSNPAGDSRTT